MFIHPLSHLRTQLSRHGFSSTQKIQVRCTSSGPTHEPSTASLSRAFRRIVVGTSLAAAGSLFAVYYFDSRSALHRYFMVPIMRYAMDPELSHKMAVKVLRSGWAPRDVCADDKRLRTMLWGEEMSNPLGIAAGFDKNGEAVDGLFDLGFAWVEIGSVTPKPQPGNPKPRVFHLPDDEAMINRYGFPSDGAPSVISRLKSRLPRIFDDLPPAAVPHHASLRSNALLAINLGKNKTSPADSPEDFTNGVRSFSSFADVLVVNVSSPNTPGLRGMQNRQVLQDLLDAVTKEVKQNVSIVGKTPRVVLKIAPDLDDEALKDIADAVKGTDGVDGVIVSNTTIQRPLSHSSNSARAETGGLSGRPLKPLSLRALRTLRGYLPAEVTLIGCGGIATGEDCLDFARAGANFVQIYTAFGYDGVGAVRRIKDELAESLAKEGTTWQEVVDRAVKQLSASSSKQTIKQKQEIRATDSNLRTLIDEATEIKRQLETLAEKFGEKIPDTAGSPEIPSPAL